MTPEEVKKEYAKKWRAEHPNYSKEWYARNAWTKEVAKFRYKVRKQKKQKEEQDNEVF